MEKFGLFDLLDKFSQVSAPKSEFSPKTTRSEKDSKIEENKNGGLIDPKLPVPPQYAMNKKMRDFVSKHDALSQKIIKDNPTEKYKK